MLTPPASIHEKVGELVAGARQQLALVAAAALYAYLRFSTVRTRLWPPPGSTSLSHDARVLTCLACSYDPIRALAGG